jgi:cell division septal protein FtsQ
MPLPRKNKKNRKTLSQGRARAPMTAYYRGSPNEESSPFSRQNPKRRAAPYLYGVLDIILAAVLIAGIAYSLMINPHPSIKANSHTFHSINDYRSAAESQLSKINNRNKITFDEQGLAAALKTQFPEIRGVQVELPLLSEKPTINLAIDQPSFFLDSRGARYIIDSSGRAVTEAKRLPNIKNLPQKLDLRAKDQPYFVKFYLGGDPLAQIGQYLAARHHFNEAGQQPAEYLDVRVPGKVFFK